ncbi:hypothetical protein IAR55_003250 [Kwoniella newhampshirensis]|uniref:SPX domain-containing protein n=1 Tax=Kwoniella newhampshirensis TaxID=1651941 RepID=A0AAW0YN88_9TREE
MKYGKEFQQILEDSSFPPEWKSSAIEYRRLKKIIKDVVNELTAMGLSQEVLHKLLVTEVEEQASQSRVAKLTQGEVRASEYEGDGGNSTTTRNGTASSRSRHQPQSEVLSLVLDVDQNVGLAPESSAQAQQRSFRFTLPSEESQTNNSRANPNGATVRPLSVAELIAARTSGCEGPSGEIPQTFRGAEEGLEKVAVISKAVADHFGAVKAEYVLAGDANHPVPQLRLHIPPSLDLNTHLSGSSLRSASTEKSETEEEDEDSSKVEQLKRLSDTTPRPFNSFQSPVLPSSPTLNRMRQAKSPIWAISSGADPHDGMQDFSLGDAVVNDEPLLLQSDSLQALVFDHEPSVQEASPSSLTSTPQREVVIPLSSDLAFFSLLTTALTSLSAFHSEQQEAFRASVESLCSTISHSISPQSSIEILPTPFRPMSGGTIGTLADTHTTPSKTSKKDLYAWREIFTLWIEAEIFESSAERDRGERTVEQAEARLKRFADEVIKRGLGDRRTMKGKRVREAWEEFLRLNVLLLDLKRFQLANINAARKILKKHDKRTALTASSGFPNLVRSSLSNQVDKDGNVSTWTSYNTSLPHILLASLTTTLLPILPSLDDYACLICTSIAFKPIRLNCGHLFCVRCLVKMQKAGTAECPLCRSKVVLLANRSSLDLAVMKFMKEWFPREVKVKQKENELEAAKEQALETGMDTRCRIM